MLTIADYSEFQRLVRPAGQQVVIIRAHNGWRADNYFTANRAAAHQAGCAAVGLYQYLPASVDPAAAARQLLATIGTLAPDEWLICDLEEGAGDQQPRWQAWRAEVLAATGRPPWLYSGLAFAQAHDLDPDWLAAYQATEPTQLPHKLWQDTDAYPWPWGHTDASVFPGTLPEFLAAAGITLPGPVTSAVVPTAPPPITIGGTMAGKWITVTGQTVGNDGQGFTIIPAPVNQVIAVRVQGLDPEPAGAKLPRDNGISADPKGTLVNWTDGSPNAGFSVQAFVLDDTPAAGN